LQTKLLRVLQEREFERLGSSRTLRTDARLIAATNRDLEAMGERAEVPIGSLLSLECLSRTCPALRERKGIFRCWCGTSRSSFSRRMNRVIETVPSAQWMPWPVSLPGNIRDFRM